MQKKKTDFIDAKNTNSVNKDGSKDKKTFNHNNLINQDNQVKVLKPKASRRKFSKSDKLKILQAYDSCKDATERGALLRKEGLYYASITKWRQHLNENETKRANSKAYKFTLQHNQVLRENVALKKKLAQAEAIIELQKKVSELLSTHVLKPEMSEA